MRNRFAKANYKVEVRECRESDHLRQTVLQVGIICKAPEKLEVSDKNIF
jgi:hypothetical protein